MTTKPPVGVGERDEGFSAWQVEDFVRRMLDNERCTKGSIQVWMGSVQTDFDTVVGVFREYLSDNRTEAQMRLDRPVQLLGTNEEAIFVIWAVYGRLLQHIPPRGVACPLEPHEALAA